ncbi:sugar ABC transporter ATP-binding protein (plasmid) [Rhizobium sp. TRM96647]|uniref:sugar ABC transporter ATP-binding protein n=1 Tax=unclassified Rhizobium TaxID=2613769 RepID=UPI0021E876FE|nr:MULTISPECIES: sugar ABC transporter ATP-binding protein [unclassified Rhizobium]MCV3735235.1 sugar ABC transporter ATP-binding protein [Rhizobium sp. TRM96647]MCV3758002.1 sugar ABC transporter ATP-binding protein [Rhizobium sp. TRM96650]
MRSDSLKEAAAPGAVASSSPPPLVRARGIAKSFSGNAVLHSVDLDLRAGEVVGLLGENGAGKSTLMHILSGGLQPDAGTLEMEGAPVRFGSVADGIEAGVSFVHQELSVVGALSVAENLHLGRMSRSRAGLVDFGLMEEASRALLERVGAGHIEPRREAATLRAGEQQLVEIAKAAARKPRLLILDEPTSSLTPHEVGGFFSYVREARAAGVAIIFITHRLEEAMALCDRVVVLRNGAIVSERRPAETSRQQLITDMTGKPAIYEHRPRTIDGDTIALSMKGVSDGRLLAGIDLDVRKGEIFGLFGLVGAGRTELLDLIHGVHRPTAGTISLFGERLCLHDPSEAVRAGIALVPEGRKTAGILPQHSVRDNAAISSLRRFSRGLFSDRGGDPRRMASYRQSLGIRMATDTQAISTLSGGNQQKVIFARALMAEPRLLLLDEPTHGVDVGAKADLYDIVTREAEKGLTVIIASSEVPEILALCDRVAILSKGRLAGILDRAAMTEDTILTMAFKEH